MHEVILKPCLEVGRYAIFGRLETTPPLLFWEIQYRHVVGTTRVTMHVWLSERGAWFSTQRAPDTICRLGSARIRWGSSQLSSPHLLAEFGEGNPRNCREWIQRKEGEGEWREKRQGAVSVLHFPTLSPAWNKIQNNSEVCYLHQLSLRRTNLHQRWNRVTGSSGHRVSNFDRVGSGPGSMFSVCRPGAVTRFHGHLVDVSTRCPCPVHIVVLCSCRSQS